MLTEANKKKMDFMATSCINEIKRFTIQLMHSIIYNH
jgi:hypothetical protein